MKETLDEETRFSIITYRIERAKETLAESEYNAKGGYYNSAVNRLYYACYYAVSALLLSAGIETNTHAGVKTQFSLHYIKSGILDLEYGTTFSLLFDKRQSSDYCDFVYCDLDLFKTLQPRAEKFVNAVVALTLKSL